jgi:hypothetical protein
MYSNSANSANSANSVMSDFSQLHLAEPIVSSRGAKSCTLSNNGAKYVLTVGSRSEPLTTPFGAQSFQNEATNRKTIEFRLPSGEMTDFWDGFDAWAVTYLTCHSARLFGKPLTIEQVRDGYKPCVSRRGDYPPTLRCKVNLSGTSAVRCWSLAEERVEVPQEFRGLEMVAMVSVMHLWQMNREFGFVLQPNDLMCSEVSRACPF